MQTKPYSASFKVGPGIVAVPFIGLLAALVFGAIYSAIDVYVPIVGIVTIAALAAYCFGLVMVVGAALRAVKSRNWLVDHAMGLLTGLFGLYSAWAFFIYFLVGGEGDISLLECFNPLLMGFAIYELGQTGWYEVKGGTPSGAFLYGIWAVEAALIVGAPALFARINTEGPFCEKGGDWADTYETLLVLGDNPGADYADLIANWKVDGLLGLEPAYQGTAQMVTVQGAWCTCCPTDGFATVKVSRIDLTVNDEGQIEQTETALVAPHVIAAEELRVFQGLVEAQLAQQAADAAAAAAAAEPVEPVES